MKKICLNCLKVFHSDYPLYYCPLVECERCDLVEIDDQMVDVIRGLWERDVGTKYCCSGHLYEGSFSPYLIIDGFYSDFTEMDLAGLRELFIKADGENSRVAIENIVNGEEGQTFVVRGVSGHSDMSPKERLKAQVDFIEFFYDVLTGLDVLHHESTWSLADA